MPVPESVKLTLVRIVYWVAGPVFIGTGHYDTWRSALVFGKTQDITFPVDLHHAEKLMVILVPEHNTISGGIYSMMSIANQMYRLRRTHGYEVLVMTRPNRLNITYYRNTHFRNAENVYRFEQILLCEGAQDIYLHIPEYAAASFMEEISYAEREYLKSRKKLHVNILNQNVELMPEKARFSELRKLCRGNISQSVAHHAYFTQAIANLYDLKTILLPAYTDLSLYPPMSFEKKEKLIIYSPDEATYKAACLRRIAKEFPDFQLIEIQGVTFDRFMDYATRCLFSITFGEGFDGYLTQPTLQGGVGFAVYNDKFFPSPEFKKYANIFQDGAEMVACICDRMKYLLADRAAYEQVSEEFIDAHNQLYDYYEYVKKIEYLALKRFEILPEAEREIA
jgi:hypothetical protein